MKTLITGGTVVSSTGSALQDVLVDGETIAAVIAPGSQALGPVTADRTIDATGRYVIPGGIDAHTHMEMPFGGTSASDTFETGTRAAAWGGTTTIVDFVVQAHGQRVQDQVAAWHEKASGSCAVDYAFHQIIGEVDDESLKAMDELIGEGITSFKLFMAYPGVFLSSDGQILQAMQKGAENGGLIMMHAENGSAIDVLVQQALQRGDTAPFFHGTSRPWQMEEEATHRAIMLADVTGAPSTSCTSRPSRPWPRSPRPEAPGRTSSARPARSTSTSRWRSSSGPAVSSGVTSRAPSGSARPLCAPGPRATRTSCGSTSAPAT